MNFSVFLFMLWLFVSIRHMPSENSSSFSLFLNLHVIPVFIQYCYHYTILFLNYIKHISIDLSVGFLKSIKLIIFLFAILLPYIACYPSNSHISSYDLSLLLYPFLNWLVFLIELYFI